MSKNLRKCMSTMQLYCSTNSTKLKKSILGEMAKNDCFFKAIYEVVNNILLKNIQLTSAQQRKVRKYTTLMHKIHQCPKSSTKRRKLVSQTGGFIQAILPRLAQLVGELIANVVHG